MENINNDEIKVNALTLKQLGDNFNKIKFHLDAAITEYSFVEKKCREIEKESGIKMQFFSE